MTNVLKKITIGNPLINLGLNNEAEIYEELSSDEEIANFYHRLLDNCPSERTTLESFIYAMIFFSTDVDARTKVKELMKEPEAAYFTIECKCGRWFVNGNRYEEMNGEELHFLEQFFRKMKRK
jgi:hypothetical protein